MKDYTRLLRGIFQLRTPIRVRGDQFVMISSINSDGEEVPFIEGTLARFTEIDKDLPWFDVENLNQAQDTVRAQIVIPEGLRPNYKPFTF